MQRTILSLIIVAGLGLSACSGNDKPEKDNSIVPAGSAAAVAPIVAADSNAPVQFKTGAVDQNVIANSKTIPASQAAQVAPAAGLNPAHGQPGHRCDIAVGAPLTSAPSTSATATAPQVQTTSSPVATPVSIPSAGGNGTAKLNPAHGQPGHDCAVQVGAPLKN